ncbi:PREDICTED: uncharacterized protein LOC109207637 [Nicotiana attenuata]|uniref:uncharacterized protein LOC109207637 n=1 Tax=Nicotiana attenuata TaxID=49451 RepID=UPI000904A67D|nr:PREDICTED: uncharacterized protein LOC109207637 [Nicotiana attenuata]
MSVPIRIITLLLLLIFIAQSLSYTISYQGSNIATKKCNFIPNSESNIDRMHAAAIIRENKLSGRKLAFSEKMKENIIEESKQENIANVKGQEITRTRRLISLDGDQKKMGGYVVFTADYKLPRHHPPKNN